MLEYWRDYPPTHILVSAYLTGGKRSSKSEGATKGKLGELMQAISDAGGSSTAKPPPAYRE